MARLIALRTRVSVNGGLLKFIRRLSLTFVLVSKTTMLGTARFSCSAAVLVPSSGIVTSSRPVWRAAMRVPRSLMMMNRIPSRYGRPFTK